jgi:hypothetical protein
MDRPALQKLLIDVPARRIDVIVVYKVDRLTRSLADFAKLVEKFDAHGVFFVSVTQSFNTTTSMGRLTLNVLLSFAQFEREVAGERIRDKIAASKKKGMWMGGVVPLGYRVEDRALHIVEDHAEIVRSPFRRYLEAGSVVRITQQLDADGVRLPIRIDGSGRSTGGGLFGSRRTPAARLWPQASRRPADGLAGSVAHTRTPGACASVTNDPSLSLGFRRRADPFHRTGSKCRWLDELLSDSLLTLESLALREGRTMRSIRMTLSLAFLAPAIVKAAVEGHLPRGFGLKRLVHLPMAWPDQWRTLGLQAPALA